MIVLVHYWGGPNPYTRMVKVATSLLTRSKGSYVLFRGLMISMFMICFGIQLQQHFYRSKLAKGVVYHLVDYI